MRSSMKQIFILFLIFSSLRANASLDANNDFFKNNRSEFEKVIDALEAGKNAKDLINMGLDKYVNERNTLGNTTLHWALDSDQPDRYTKILLELKADVNAENRWSEYPLHIAMDVELKDQKNLKSLITKKSINAQNFWGQTPLILAIQRNHLENIKTLIEAGADVNATYQGKTALDLMKESKNPEMIRIFKKARESLNKKCGTSVSSLMNEFQITILKRWWA